MYFLVSFFTNKVDVDDDLLEEKEGDQQKTNWWMTAIGIGSFIALGSAIAYQVIPGMLGPKLYLLVHNEDGLMSAVLPFRTIKDLKDKLTIREQKIGQCCKDASTGAVYMFAQKPAGNELPVETCAATNVECPPDNLKLVHLRAELSKKVKAWREKEHQVGQVSVILKVSGPYGTTQRTHHRPITLLDVYDRLRRDDAIVTRKTPEDGKVTFFFEADYGVPILTDYLPDSKRPQAGNIQSAIKAYEDILKHCEEPIKLEEPPKV